MQQRSSSGGFGMPRASTGVKALVVANVLFFVLYLLALRSGLAPLADAIPMTPERVVERGHLWQLFTYMFVHSPSGISHLLFNMLFLWIFGWEVELRLGLKRFLGLYFGAGVAGGVLAVALAALGRMLWPDGELAAGWISPHLGASGAVYGITACWGALLWYEVRTFLFLGQLRVRTFFFIILGIEVLTMLSFSGNLGGSLAHMGGMSMGFGYGWIVLHKPQLEARAAERKRVEEAEEHQRKLSRFTVIEGGKSDDED